MLFLAACTFLVAARFTTVVSFTLSEYASHALHHRRSTFLSMAVAPFKKRRHQTNLYSKPVIIQDEVTDIFDRGSGETANESEEVSPDEESLEDYDSFSKFQDIPDWLSKNCDNLNFSTPTIVQQMTIPTMMYGKDIILQAQTGSGKTLAYSIPILSKIDPTRSAIQAVIVVPTRELCMQVTGVLRQLARASPNKVLIMPLMEGSKNRRNILWATAEPPHIIVGNPRSLQKLVDMGRLRLNAVSFVVMDEVDACLIKPETRQELHKLLSRHLSNSFQDASDQDLDPSQSPMKESLVYKDLAKDVREAERYRSSRQTILCSATIPQRQHFASTCFQKGWTESLPTVIHVSAADLMPGQVLHEYIPCASDKLKEPMVKYILKSLLNSMSKDNDYDEAAGGVMVQSDSDRSSGSGAALLGEEDSTKFQAIIFLDDAMLADAQIVLDLRDSLEDFLEELNSSTNSDNYSDSSRSIDSNGNCNDAKWSGVALLLDTMSSEQRTNEMESFRDGTSTLLLCADLAARGLDVPNTALVVQMSLPREHTTYLHRAGRTGRNGRFGRVVTLTDGDNESFAVRKLENELGIDISKRVLKKKKKN